MRVLTWILRGLAVLLLIRIVLRLLFGRKVLPIPPWGRTVGGPQLGGKSGGDLVRDPQCGTYVAKVSAVTASVGDETFYFCSATCRDAYRAAKAGRV